MTDRVRAAAAQFDIPGRLVEVAPYGTGHINDTYASRYESSAGSVRYIHQRINRHVFRDVPALMDNIERVTTHARRVITEAGGDADRETLTLIPTRDGRSVLRADDGEWWRTYLFIEGARTYDLVRRPEHVLAASRAFGEFQRLLVTLPGGRLNETIPHFHDTPRRLAAFDAIVAEDPVGRAASVQREIEFVAENRSDASVIVDLLARGAIPERVTHNDTKLNNVMIDDATDRGICVIDLDTVMPGCALYDFGDSVRIAAATAAEDERDLDRVGFDLHTFELLARGYLEAASDMLTAREIDLMAFSARLMTFECGVRFLADHLAGDTYFKVHRDDHNLDRARTQFRMVSGMERERSALEGVVDRWRERTRSTTAEPA